MFFNLHNSLLILTFIKFFTFHKLWILHVLSPPHKIQSKTFFEIHFAKQSCLHFLSQIRMTQKTKRVLNRVFFLSKKWSHSWFFDLSKNVSTKRWGFLNSWLFWVIEMIQACKKYWFWKLGKEIVWKL